MIALDTSVLVRYLTAIPAASALRAHRFVDDADRLGVSTLVMIETAHVLRSRYGVTRGDVLQVLLDFVALENVEVLGLPKDVAIEALARAREYEGAPLADALIAATAAAAGAESIAAFDRRMPRHGLAVVEP